jgi:hypothetical protein
LQCPHHTRRSWHYHNGSTSWRFHLVLFPLFDHHVSYM